MNIKINFNPINKFLYLILVLLILNCSPEPSYNVEFYKRAEEYKQKNPNIVIASDGKRVFKSTGSFGLLDPIRAKNTPKKIYNNIQNNNEPIAGEILELNPIPDSIGNIYFLGFCKNTGTRSIHYGKAIIKLLDKDKKQIAESYGYCSKKQLMKGEVTPVKILVSKAPAYVSYTIKLTSDNLSSVDTDLPVMQFFETKLVAGRYKGSNNIIGKLKNIGQYKVSYPSVTGVTFNSTKKIISIDNAYLNKKILNPNETVEFNIQVYVSNYEIPKSLELSYDGTISK